MVNTRIINQYRPAALQDVLQDGHFYMIDAKRHPYDFDWLVSEFMGTEDFITSLVSEVSDIKSALDGLRTAYLDRYSIFKTAMQLTKPEEHLKWLIQARTTKNFIRDRYPNRQLIKGYSWDIFEQEFAYFLIYLLSPNPYGIPSTSLSVEYHSILREYDADARRELEIPDEDDYELKNPFHRRLTEVYLESMEFTDTPSLNDNQSEKKASSATAMPEKSPISVAPAAPIAPDMSNVKQLTVDDYTSESAVAKRRPVRATSIPGVVGNSAGTAEKEYPIPTDRTKCGLMFMGSSDEERSSAARTHAPATSISSEPMNIVSMYLLGMSYTSIYWLTGISRKQYDAIVAKYHLKGLIKTDINFLISYSYFVLEKLKDKTKTDKDIVSLFKLQSSDSLAWFKEHASEIVAAKLRGKEWEHEHK